MQRQANPTIKARYDSLRALPKADLIRRFPSRLDMSHLRSEPKATIVSAILEAEFGRRQLEAWNGK